jgi:molybdenum cofactor cytidylyltransferase
MPIGETDPQRTPELMRTAELMRAAEGTNAGIVPLVLAAGKGERLGGNKALLAVGGTPALRRVLLTAAGAGLGSAVVVLGHEAARVRAMIDALAEEFATASGLAVCCTVNADPDRGQTSSVQCGLTALPTDTAAALVWPVDHPLVTSDDLQALAAAAAAHPEAAVVRPTHGGRGGHPVLLRRALFPAVRALPPSAPLRDLLRGELARTVFVERPTDHVLRDLDTPADLAAVRPLMTPEQPA